MGPTMFEMDGEGAGALKTDKGGDERVPYKGYRAIKKWGAVSRLMKKQGGLLV